ncbi:hypothetical protein [Runella sp.]|uniref:hypothetical protein n=1 Tax=Runella sp. TaxID=1960881 RepID=UPI003D0F2289
MAYLMSFKSIVFQSKKFSIKSIEGKTGALLQPLSVAIFGLSFFQNQLFGSLIFLQSTVIKFAFFTSTLGFFLVSVFEFSPVKYSKLFVKSFIKVFSLWVFVLVFNLVFLIFRNQAEEIVKFDLTLNHTVSFLWLFLLHYIINVIHKNN